MKDPVLAIARDIVGQLAQEYRLTFEDVDGESTAGYAVVTVAYILRTAIKEGRLVLPPER